MTKVALRNNNLYTLVMKTIPLIPPVEDKAYGIDCSEKERAAIKSHVYLYDNNLIIMRIIPQTSPFSLILFEEKLTELSGNLKFYYLIIDLTGPSHRPDAKMRALIRDSILKNTKLRRAVVVIGSNKLLKYAAQFIFSLSDMPPLLICNSFKEALEALNNGTEH